MGHRRRNRGYKLPPGPFAAIPVDAIKNAAALLSAPVDVAGHLMRTHSAAPLSGMQNLTAPGCLPLADRIEREGRA